MTSGIMPARHSPLHEASLGLLEAARGKAFPDWVLELHGEANRSFQARGLPTNRDEAWRFTPLRPLLKLPVEHSTTSRLSPELDAEVNALPSEFGHPIVLLDGQPKAGLADAPAGIEVLSLRDALSREPAWVQEHLGKLCHTEEGFSALNTALFEDGLVIRVPRSTTPEKPLHLVFASSSSESPRVSLPRVLLVLEPNSSLDLIETRWTRGDGAQLTNSVIEAALADNARLRHLRTLHGVPRGFTVDHTSVRLGAAARYDSHALTLGGELSRLDLHVALEGPGAECSLDGLFLANSGESVDHHTRVEHLTARGTSRQKYKGILSGTGHAVFDGTVVVHRDAQQTVAHQENRNILLSDETTLHTKPHLEIDADDVQCSHGATVGALDPDELFYLQARGIDAEVARGILTFAFAHEMIDRISLPGVGGSVARRLLSRIPGGELVGEMR